MTNETSAVSAADKLEEYANQLPPVHYSNTYTRPAIAELRSLRKQLAEAQEREAQMAAALRQARGALHLDAMVNDDGKMFGTTTVALEAIDAALPDELCDDEGCPHHGTPHVCVNSPVAPAPLQLPQIPDDDADFTPELARKIIAAYQSLLAPASPSPVLRDAVIEECATVAKDWLEDWGADLHATAEDYMGAKVSGRFNERRIAPETASQFARQFKERGDAVYDCGVQVADAIRALSRPVSERDGSADTAPAPVIKKVLRDAHEHLHALTAIIPFNDTAYQRTLDLMAEIRDAAFDTAPAPAISGGMVSVPRDGLQTLIEQADSMALERNTQDYEQFGRPQYIEEAYGWLMALAAADRSASDV